MASQNPGDKSGELSVRTQDLLEEASQDDEDEVDDNDDDLSQMSYDANDHSASNNDVSALGALISDGEDDDLMFFDDGVEEDDASEASEARQIQGSHGDEDSEDGSLSSEEEDVLEEQPQDYRAGHDAQSTLQDLIDVYSTRNQVSIEQYERSLQQLHTKWETVLEQAVYDHEQQLDQAEQERQEMMDHIDELKRAHEDELEESKETVMEQSQKIILEEMKLNADLDLNLVKSEETYEFEIQKAVEQSQKEMNEEFEIALSGMKIAQDEMKVRYERLIEDTKIRVRDEVKAEFKGKYENEMMSFKETYEEMKAQVLDQTMKIQTLELQAGQSTEKDGLVSALENELKVLRKAMEENKLQYEKQLSNLMNAYKVERETLKNNTANMISSEDHQTAVKKAKEKTRKDMTEEFDIVLKGLKSSQAELATRYEELVKDTETRVREEVYAEAKKDADRKINVFKVQYEEIKKEVLEMALQVEKLEMDNGSKASEIEQLSISVESQESLVEELQSDVGSKNTEIARLQAELKGKKNMILEKNDLLLTKDNQIKALDVKVKAMINKRHGENTIVKEQADIIDQLRAEMDVKESDIKALAGEIDTFKAEISGISAELESKNNLIRTKDSTIEDLGAIIVAKDKVIQNKGTESAKAAQLEIQAAVEANRQQMKHEFEKNMEKERDAQEESKSKYEKLIEDTKLRVREEVESEIKLKYEKQSGAAAESLLKVAEKEKVISSLESELKVLRLVMEETKTHHDKQIERMQSDHNKEICSLQKGLNGSASKTADDRREDVEKQVENGQVVNLNQTTNANDKTNDATPVAGEINIDTSLNENGEDQDTTPKAGVGGKEKESSKPATRDIPMVVSTDDPVSPLGMTSPLAAPKKSMMNGKAMTSRTPQRIPKTVNTAKRPPKGSSSRRAGTPVAKSESKRKVIRAGPGSHNTAPVTPNRIVRKRTPSRLARGEMSPRSAPSTPIDRSARKRTPAQQARTSTKASSRARALERPTVSTTKKYSKSPNRSSRHALDSVRERSRAGLFSSNKTVSSIRDASDIKLLIITAPLTDRRKMMVNFLKIKLVSSPLEATHVIVSDDDHHIRRTSKLMASLCVTPHIMKADWLEDCYNKRKIKSPRHYTVLNDYIAEKAYSFSMKQTIKEGNERRQFGGLLHGWKIYICANVAGNKAPKEADLRMMIAAAGGTWLEPNEVPLKDGEDPSHVIVITSHPATTEQLEDENAKKAAENGAGYFTTSWLFDSFMHQKMFGIRRGLGF